MDVIGLDKSNFLKREVWEFGQQIKNLDCEKRRLEHKVYILKYPNDACESIIALYFFSKSKEKIDQVASVILSKLAKKDTERFPSSSVKTRLINEKSSTMYI